MTRGFRQTGRTSRMLAEAVELAASGRAVCIIAANHWHADQLQSQLPNDMDIVVEADDGYGGLNWDTLTFRGAGTDCDVLIDHYAIEQRFAKVLNMLHRWDK